jgi:RNA polymerase sigma-70 factor (ECF subfamily)
VSTGEYGPFGLHQLQQRNAEAFRWLVEQHQSLVLALGQTMGLSGADLDDAAAEVFAHAYRALPRFEGQSQLGTWIYRIAVRTIGKLRHGRQIQRTAEHELPCEHADDAQPAPHDRLVDAEMRELIWAAVAELDERQAAAVEMHYRQGWGIDRIAEVLQCPPGTVKTLLHRARQRLRERMVGQGVER